MWRVGVCANRNRPVVVLVLDWAFSPRAFELPIDSMLATRLFLRNIAGHSDALRGPGRRRLRLVLSEKFRLKIGLGLFQCKITSKAL
jgi:hypothetical protein